MQNGSFLTAELGESAFSAVTFWAILEHLLDPAAFLAKAARILRPGGICCVLVPNFRSLAVRFLGYQYPLHSAATRQLFHRVNAASPRKNRIPKLKVIHTASLHFNPLVILQDWRSQGKAVSDQDRARLLRRTTGYKQNRYLKPVKRVLSVAEFTLGKMFLADNLVVVMRRTE